MLSLLSFQFISRSVEFHVSMCAAALTSWWAFWLFPLPTWMEKWPLDSITIAPPHHACCRPNAELINCHFFPFLFYLYFHFFQVMCSTLGDTFYYRYSRKSLWSKRCKNYSVWLRSVRIVTKSNLPCFFSGSQYIYSVLIYQVIATKAQRWYRSGSTVYSLTILGQ